MRGAASIDAEVYATPTAAAVARLIDSHGLEAAVARWHWLGERTICTMARSGRAADGRPSTIVRARTWSDLDAAVAVEAAFALGSMKRGERAAGLTAANSGRGICQARGVQPPCISSEERGLATRIGHLASRGDAAAIAARDARHAFERAVGAVLRTALALVPAQPATGRYRLPRVDARLAEALTVHDAAAIGAVFPELAALKPAQPEPEPKPKPLVTAIVSPSAQEPHPMAARRRIPTVDVILSERRRGRTVAQIASDFEVSPQGIYAALRRLGVPAGNARPAKAALASEPVVEAVGTAAPPEAAPWTPGTDYAHVVVVPGRSGKRLGIQDLAIAGALVQQRRLSPEIAVALVRADVDAASRATTETTYGGVPASRIDKWLEAIANGDPLPELDEGEAVHG